jgi:hypothetical protein
MFNRDAFLVHERTGRLLAVAAVRRLVASPHAGWTISRGFASLVSTILGPRAA